MSKKSKGPDGAWSHDQVIYFVKLLKKNVGVDGWRFMTNEVREAFVAAEAFGIVRSQHLGNVDVKDMDWLLTEMRIEAGLIKCEDFENEAEVSS